MSQHVRGIIAISILVAILMGAGTALTYATRLQAEIQHRTIEIGGVSREYRLDTQVPPDVVRAASQIFESGGHPIEFRLLEGAGHGWNNNFGVNRILWNFVRDKRREVGR